MRSTKSRARKADQRAAKRMSRLMQEAYERRVGSTPSLFFEDEYANAVKYDGALIKEIRKEFGV